LWDKALLSTLLPLSLSSLVPVFVGRFWVAFFQRTFDDGERAQKAAVAAIEHESPFMHPFARKAQVCAEKQRE
jgi:hypothetical protein